MAKRITLTNANGVTLEVTNLGASITKLLVPDKNNNFADVVLAFDNLDTYATNPAFLGCTVGRYANRIAKGRFRLNNREHQLSLNNAPNTLHGGPAGFWTKLWDVESVTSRSVVFTYTSVNGEEGYPGTMKVRTEYKLTDDNQVIVDMQAKSDADTVVNLCNHTYWNLAGHQSGHIRDHVLTINADHYTPTDNTLIPTGEIASVRGTPLDFTSATPVGARINHFKGDKVTGGGYDHNFVLNRTSNDEGKLAFCARLRDPRSGRVMEIHTTAPGVQLYTGNWLDSSLPTPKQGTTYRQHQGLCLETQAFPDSPNKGHFPSPILRKGQVYHHVMVCRFYAGAPGAKQQGGKPRARL